MYMWVGEQERENYITNPLQSRVKSGYRGPACPRSQDSEGKTGPDSRGLFPDSRKPPGQ